MARCSVQQNCISIITTIQSESQIHNTYSRDTYVGPSDIPPKTSQLWIIVHTSLRQVLLKAIEVGSRERLAVWLSAGKDRVWGFPKLGIGLGDGNAMTSIGSKEEIEL